MRHEIIIDNLWVDDSAKEILRDADRIANSDNERVREIIPSLFVISDGGCGVSSYGKVYGKIIEESQLLQIRGSETFIELVFPKNNEQEEKLFFSSPQRVASIRNRFYGTMLISFSEYSGQDLLKSDSLKRLLNFIEQNKYNIHFVFHVLPDFSVKSQLVSRLREQVNIVEICLSRPAVDKAFDYVMNELAKIGLRMDDGCKKRFEDSVLARVVHESSYLGYKSLNNLIRRINYELILNGGDRDMVVDDSLIDKLVNVYEMERNSISNNSIGFHM